MSYPGGSSTASGVEYQNWFLALQVAYCFFEKDRIIFPECFIDDFNIIDDIKVLQGKQSTFFNVKQNAPAEHLHWGISQLVSQKVVAHIRNQFEADNKAKIVFVSESNCYLITEIFNRVRNALTPMDISQALQSERCAVLWEDAKEAFGYNDFELLALARNVSMRSLPLYEIKKLIEHRFVPLGQPFAVANLFLAKSLECSKNKTRIEKIDINRWLAENDINFK